MHSRADFRYQKFFTEIIIRRQVKATACTFTQWSAQIINLLFLTLSAITQTILQHDLE